ncbi:hypothetical protein CMV_018055 [Castanea mollissima]|uniref:Uncharacterized protein n=1 Tax=Castanea mollissima TaxID=60419 RepID=A0A8J4VQ04_9ROSI|nr:hypothetical protein CMV_018055 [Castanea mollissima]
MAKEASKCLFILFLSLFTICSSGTLVGFSCKARATATSSPTRTISFLKQNKVTLSQIRVFAADHKGWQRLFGTNSTTSGFVNLKINPFSPQYPASRK